MESAKECVTTHLPNELALKMDGAVANGPVCHCSCDGVTTVSKRANRLLCS